MTGILSFVRWLCPCDQSVVIEHVALNDPDPVIRRMAASRVTSVSVLERIAREGK